MIPSLCERIEDLGLLIPRILRVLGINTNLTFAAAAYARMCFFDWPENVRQRMHVIRRAATLEVDGWSRSMRLNASGLGRRRRL